MEFKFDIATLLPDEITKVDNTLLLSAWKGTSSTRCRVEYQMLYEVINVIGENSSFAQGLNNVITNSEKLQNSDHTMYLMKEHDAISNKSVVVGMLKIGRKKLFLLNEKQVTKESAPLCVLDFYIHESRQRRGYGRRLFEHMLRDQDVLAGHMAVDKPSDKFLGFLKKHYGLHQQIPQINNFVIFDTFFMDRPICNEESEMTYVSRSSRPMSPESGNNSRAGSRGGSRSGSRHGSPGGSRRSSNAFAGKPSRPANSGCMADILHGKQERHIPSVRVSPRYQTTLDWMRGPGNSSGGESPYSRTPGMYSASRTPSNAGSPLYTPHGGSPPVPATPPHISAHSSRQTSRKASFEALDNGTEEALEKSVAPTPATSPDRASSQKTVEEDEKSNHTELEDVVDEVSKLDLEGAPTKSEMRGWRDSVSRSSQGLVDHMASPKGGTMTGVLHDNDSVHGHLKFHHHALW